MTIHNTKANPNQWVDRYADYLRVYSLSRIGDEDQARDLVQETFLAALECINEFEGKSSEKTWLTAILNNKIIDSHRHKAKLSKMASIDSLKNGVLSSNFELYNLKQTYFPDPFGIEQDFLLHNKELHVILNCCMQKLPPLWLAVFSMKHIDNESTRTICAELNVSDANFWVIIHRAKVNLRACLQKNWLDTGVVR